MSNYPYYKVVPLLFVALMAGCGGGAGTSGTAPPTNNPANPPGGAQPPGTNPTNPQPPTEPSPGSGSMTMSCVDGPNYQCSGGSIIQSENGVALTGSGVQVYGTSTSDLAAQNPSATGAWGLALSTGGVAEIRVAKDSNGIVSQAAVLLSNLGLMWDGRTDRPQIIETFNPTQGRVQLDSRGALNFVALPPSSDLSFYDYAIRGTAATQQHYANNRYFPRTDNPSRCEHSGPCKDIETTGLQSGRRLGDWREGGIIPDAADAGREHGDGDIHAGDAQPGSNPPWLEGGTGYGVPFPGSKGYRTLDLWSFQYANLASWLTQDTVSINEWSGTGGEHNKNRRGMVAFGAVSNPTAVPTAGSANYAGIAYGMYSRNGTDDPAFFSGPANVTVNFATREAVVTISNTVLDGGSSVPVALRAVTTMGPASSNAANYMTGPVDNGTLRGGLSARHFGPVVSTGSSGQGPAEIGGAFSLSNSSSRAAVIGGFIARKQ
jgi:hypothetical protein